MSTDDQASGAQASQPGEQLPMFNGAASMSGVPSSLAAGEPVLPETTTACVDTNDTNDDSNDDSNHASLASPSQAGVVDQAGKPAESCLPWGSSLWDSLPAELRAMVFEFACPLTRFINGFLGTKAFLSERDLHKEAFVDIWRAVIRIDWDGDLELLPKYYDYYNILKADDLVKVRSRSLYDRMCAAFPGNCWARDVIDEATNEYNAEAEYPYLPFCIDVTNGAYFVISECLVQIPMRHCWLDKLDEYADLPVWQARIAISYGHVDLLKHLVHERGVDLARFVGTDWKDRSNPAMMVMDVAARCGSVEILQMLYDAGNRSCTSVAIDLAAQGGYLDAIQWLHQHCDKGCSTAAMVSAAKIGRLDIVQWLHANRTEGCTADAMDGAASGGHLGVVQWLHANRTEGCTTQALDGAAAGGHLGVVQWLHAHRTEGGTTDAMDGAATGGHMHVLKWLHANRREGCTVKAMEGAASSGHLRVVQWLHEHRTEGCTTDAMDKAAGNGHLHVVKWLHANRTEGCTTNAMDQAAKNDHLGVASWLHENRTEGCTTNAMDCAAKEGDLDVIKWLQEHRTEGCTEKAMEDAVYFGHQAIVAYLVQNRPELSATEAMMVAIEHSRLEIVEWLHDNAPDSYTPEAFSKACEEGDVDVVSFFLDCEHEFNVEMLQAAADNSSDLAQMMYDSLSLDRARVLLKEATDNGSECGEIAQCLESLIAKLAASSKPNSK